MRRRWPLLTLVPLAGWAGVRLAHDDAPTEAAPVAAPPVSTLVSFEPPVGERTTDARCWMVAIDQSTSMSSADPLGTRADAVRAAAEYLAAYGLSGDRIGETWFADEAAVTPPVPAGDFRPATTSHAVGRGTKIADALDAAIDSMATRCADAQRVVVLVTDGQAASPGEFGAIADVLTQVGRRVRVHLVAMNENAAFETARPFWEDPALGIDSITTVRSFGRHEVAEAVAHVLAAETGQQVVAK